MQRAMPFATRRSRNWVACNRARFPATRPRVFCELQMMKIVILIYQNIQEKFAYGELFMLVMIGYIFMLKVGVNPSLKNEMWLLMHLITKKTW